jgi:O-acetyl-ADP-ribose deacetylase (regulator of RNase III)
VVEFVTGNLLEADADAFVNTVNAKGVMGKGVALQFKRAFPANYKAYRAACAAGEVKLGRMFVFDTGRLERPRYIINFPTKDHWRSRSRLGDIEAGLQDLRRVLTELAIESVALPPLGCGLGGLDWTKVRPRIEVALADLPMRAHVFEPRGAPAPELMPERRPRPRMTPFRATLIWLLGRYLAPGESASPLEVQKLLYFLQEAGEPLGLRFEGSAMGPTPTPHGTLSKVSRRTTSSALAMAQGRATFACSQVRSTRQPHSWRTTRIRARGTGGWSS